MHCCNGLVAPAPISSSHHQATASTTFGSNSAAFSSGVKNVNVIHSENNCCDLICVSPSLIRFWSHALMPVPQLRQSPYTQKTHRCYNCCMILLSQSIRKKFGQSTLCTSSWLSGSGWLYLHMRGVRTRSAGPGSQSEASTKWALFWSTQQIYKQSTIN